MRGAPAPANLVNFANLGIPSHSNADSGNSVPRLTGGVLVTLSGFGKESPSNRVEKMSSSLPRVVESYKRWILANPQVLTDIESTARWLSYFTAGQFNNSSLASELIYTLPNLLVLFNDLLLYSGKKLYLKQHKFESKIKVWLTILEYTETLLEVSGKRICGQKGKWTVVTGVQVSKAILRLLLVHTYKERITKCPTLTPLNREQLCDVETQAQNVLEGFTLKRSGVVVRMVRSSNPIEHREWESLTPQSKSTTRKLMLAESLYVLKPLIHLSCVSMTGEKQWPPWLVAFAVDILSLKLIGEESKSLTYTKEERKELMRRRLNLLLYILRSPFYDKYSKDRLHSMLNALSVKIPLARLIAEPLKKYLPHWQSMYFYMWSS